MKEITMTIFPIFVVCANFSVMILSMPRKKSLSVTLFFFGLLVGANTIADLIMAGLGINDPTRGFRAYIYLPLVILMFDGLFFQKVFGFFLPMTLCATLMLPAEALARIFMRYGEFWYWLAMLVIPLSVLAVYIIIVWRYGHRLIDRLFGYGTEKEWALYSFSSVACFIIVSSAHPLIELNPMVGVMVIFFVLWSIIILCFAIINTHDKYKQKYEIDLAHDIISSGRGYYDKLTEMTEQLHILRHDYKHHILSVQRLMETGAGTEARDYLAKMNKNADESTFQEYCQSRVLNALLDRFDESCKNEEIKFTVKIVLPPANTIDDYELCVIIGNLLENALTACRRTVAGQQRYIELLMHPQNQHYGIKVINSYDGILRCEGKTLYSTKESGGLGINSIKSVAKHHNGDYIPEWDQQMFSALVVLELS